MNTTKLGKVLLVDDDDDLARVVGDLLEQMGFEHDRVADGKSGVEQALDHNYSLIVLDNYLPELEGIEVCRQIRETKPNLPIVMLTSNAEEINKVLLLEMGADDYITKPFSTPELKARIKAVLRRFSKASATPEEKSIVKVGDLKIDFERRGVWLSEEKVPLTSHEYDIIAVLASRPGRPFTRTEIIESIYGVSVESYELGMNTHVTRIRAKLEPEPHKPKYILTERGVGYKLAEPEDLA